jgi:hypothetical protein
VGDHSEIPEVVSSSLQQSSFSITSNSFIRSTPPIFKLQQSPALDECEPDGMQGLRAALRKRLSKAKRAELLARTDTIAPYPAKEPSAGKGSL